MIYKIKRFSW